MKKTYLTVIMVLMLLLSQTAEAATVNIDVNSTNQTIRGFGAATPWYLPPATDSEIESAFGTGGGQIGLTILRLTIEPSSSDWSTWVPSAKKAQDMGAIIIAAPWYAPSSLTEFRDGETRIQLDKYDEYIDHLNAFITFMQNNDVNIYGLSVQNEPDAGDWTNWSPSEMLTLMRDYAHALEGTKVMAPESYHFDRAYSDPILNDTTACANTDIICGHIYGGGLYSYPLAEEKGKEVWMTEYLFGENNSGNNWPWAMELAKNISDVMQANMNAYVWWTMVRYYGPIGDGTTAENPQDPNESYPAKGEVTKKGYVMSQYSKFVRPGYIRIDATENPSFGIYVTAYKSGNTLVIVAVNQNSSTDIELDFSFNDINDIAIIDGDVYRTSETENCVYVGSFAQPLTLPASSITTIALTITFDTTPPAVPTNLLAVAGDEIVWLDWDDNNDPNLAGYNIYRSTTPGSYTDPLNASLLDSSDYTDNDVNNGMTYYYVVTAEDTSTNESNYSSEVSASPSSAIGGMGTILREWWAGITGGSVSDLTSDPNFPDNPTNIEYIKSLEGPTDWADSYGARISGYVHPPNSGDYTFWIASDANSELWLSTNGNPENISLIANVPGFTNRRQWDKYPQQQSSPISLTAGQKYYIEVLHKEDTDSDNVAVAWQGPSIAQQVIYGIYLSPFFAGFYGDFTDESAVDMNDLAEFIKLWLEDNCVETSAMDLDGNCIVNFYEFSAIVENWRRITVPSPPANLSITASTTSVSLDWDDNTESYLAGYNVYRSTTSGSGYSKLNSSPISDSIYTDNTATNGVAYYYVVTAVDIYSNESGYSNEVSRLVIQENTTGFCGVDGSVSSAYSGYTGTGYADTYNAPTMGVDWRISVSSSGSYTFVWRYANDGSNRPGKLLVNGSEKVSSISFPDTGGWSNWSLVSVSGVSLTDGVKDIRLEATDAAIYGLANIDYLMVTGSASLTPESCP